MSLPTFKVRCSGISEIITNPKSKADLISAGAKTHCEKWLRGQLFERKPSFSSKQTAKGNIVEDESIAFVSELLGMPGLKKNKIHFDDEYCQGTPDLITDDLVIDMKNSWGWETFPILKDEIPDTAYYWQLQGYMRLTGKSQAKLIYTLIDTPYHLIQSEARRYCFNNGIEFDEYILAQFIKDMTYPDIDESLKIKIFDIERNDEAIDKIEEKVKGCREYITQKYNNF